MLRRYPLSFTLAAGLFFNPVLLNAEQGLIEPKKGTVYEALLEGLKLLAVGDIEQWISRYCDGIRLCSNAPVIHNIRAHRAEMQQKIASSCLKNGGDALQIDHVMGNPEIDVAVKVYLVCEPNNSPRFYSLRRTVDLWFFISL